MRNLRYFKEKKVFDTNKLTIVTSPNHGQSYNCCNEEYRTRYKVFMQLIKTVAYFVSLQNPDNVGTSGSSASSNSNDSTAHEEDLCSDSTTTYCSTEYSDWIADHGLNLEPPKRSKRKPKKRTLTPSSDTDRRRSRRPKKKVNS